MSLLPLYLATGIANTSVLIIEISGARMLAPYLGTSTEVWAGIIAVILGGLAIGYWTGGLLAKDSPSIRTLSLLLFAGGLSALVIVSLKEIIPTLVLGYHAGGGLTGSTVLTSFLLFAPASIFLGAVSPYATRLALTDIASAAPMLGRMSAIGTLGSILGALGTGAILIPTFGLETILIGNAVVLILFALLLRPFSYALSVIALCMFFGSYVFFSTVGDLRADTVMARADTAYSHLWIGEVDFNGSRVRYLQTDPLGIQCGMYVENGTLNLQTLVFPYLEAFLLSDSINPKPTHALVLGGCNYSFPHAYQTLHPETELTVVELDPGMTKIAQDWFKLPENPPFSIVHADARIFLNQNKTEFDVIFVDVFTPAGTIPHHLVTRETSSLLTRSLSENGSVIINVISALSGEQSLFGAAMYRTLRDAFPHVSIYRIQNTEDSEMQNLIFIAKKGNPAELPPIFETSSYVFEQVSEQHMSNVMSSGLLLTDDFAPVESLTASMREEYFSSRRK